MDGSSVPKQNQEIWPSDKARQAAYSTPASLEASQVPAEVLGRLPEWLKGIYIRDGPGEITPMKHLFDGYAMLLKMEVDGESNTVLASHRFLESEAYKHWRSTGRMRFREFGTPVGHGSLLSKAAGTLRTLVAGALGWQAATDNASVAVIPQGSNVVAMTETVAGTYLVDPRDLKTLQRVHYSDSVQGDGTTAHPSVLPNGDLIQLFSKTGSGFTVVRQPLESPATRQALAHIPHRHRWAQSWIHDWPTSLNYTVIPEQPLFFNLWAMLTGGEYFFDWRPEEGSLLHVVPLDGKQGVKTCRAPPFLVMHYVNAFESEDARYLHVDAAVYEEPSIIRALFLEPLRAPFQGGEALPQSHFRRLTIDLQTPEGPEVATGWKPLVENEGDYGNFFEFPQIPQACRGKPYRYAYGVCATRPTNAANSLVKFDTQERSCKVWHEPGILVGEPYFVPAPSPASEDDGVVIAMVVQRDGSAALVILEGTSMREVARAVLPYSLPMGFHATWLGGAVR